MVIMNVVTRMTRRFLKQINRIDDLLMMAAIMVMITYDGDHNVDDDNSGNSKDGDGNYDNVDINNGDSRDGDGNGDSDDNVDDNHNGDDNL